jgi:hypothetical protein
LDAGTVGPSENFFELDGNSLRTGQVIHRLHAAFQVDLTIVTIFRRPKVADIMAEIARFPQVGIDNEDPE